MTVAIVGAGATGLACAAALGRSAVVVDRIPVCGGILGFDHADTRRLEAAARPPARRSTWARRRSPGTAPSLVHGTGRRPPHPCGLPRDRVRRTAAQPRRAAHRRRPRPRRRVRHGRVPPGRDRRRRGPPAGHRRRWRLGPAGRGGAAPRGRRSGARTGRAIEIRGGSRVAELVCDDARWSATRWCWPTGSCRCATSTARSVDGLRTVYAQPCDDFGSIAAARRPADAPPATRLR